MCIMYLKKYLFQREEEEEEEKMDEEAPRQVESLGGKSRAEIYPLGHVHAGTSRALLTPGIT